MTNLIDLTLPPSTVIIIGNGFDLSLKIPTSFNDFVKSSQFESILDSNLFAKWLIDRFRDRMPNWIDIEMELTGIALGNVSKYNFEKINPLFVTEVDYYSLFKEIKTSLHKYLNSIDYTITEEIRASKAYAFLKHQVGEKPLIINFNYTPTVINILEDLGHHSFAGKDHVFIHNSLKEGNIIMGVGAKEKAQDKFSFMKKTSQSKYKGYQINKTLRDADRVFFYGHSLGQPDYGYFDKFFAHCVKDDTPEKEISIVTLDELSESQIMVHLEKMTTNSVMELREYNEFQFDY